MFSRRDFVVAGGASALVGMTSCGGGSAPAGAAAPIATPTPVSGPTATASIALSRASQAGSVPAMLAGLSYEKAKISAAFFTTSNTTLIGCFRRLGSSIMRIGGNSVDKTTWTPNGAGNTSGQVAPSDISALAAFVSACGWQIIYGINLGTNTSADAAAEAAFAATAFGSSLYAFEIGNECDLYSENGIRATTYTLADFESEWSSYASAIRASVPNAPLSGPASASHITSWTVPFASAEAANIRQLTQHYYRANGQNASSTIQLLLAGDPALSGDFSALLSAAQSAGIPNGYRLAEANSFYNGGAPNVSDAYGTALWAIDFLLMNAQGGSAGVNFHGGGDGPGYTPIADSGGVVIEVRPEYYGMLFVMQIAPGPMYPVTVNSALELSAYAIAGSDGATYVAIVNKDASTTATASIALGAAAASATPLVLQGAGLSATTGTTLGGAAVTAAGSWTPQPAAALAVSGSTLNLNVAPATAILLTIR